MEYAYDNADLAFLMAHDSDEFNRWDAGQKLATNVILAMVEQRARGEDGVPRNDAWRLAGWR